MLLLDSRETKIRILCKNPYGIVHKNIGHLGGEMSLTCEGHRTSYSLEAWFGNERNLYLSVDYLWWQQGGVCEGSCWCVTKHGRSGGFNIS